MFSKIFNVTVSNVCDYRDLLCAEIVLKKSRKLSLLETKTHQYYKRDGIYFVSCVRKWKIWASHEESNLRPRISPHDSLPQSNR